MVLFRLLSIVLGGLTGAAILVLVRIVLGVAVAARGQGGGTSVPGLPPGGFETTLLVSAALAGFVTAWTAPDRPLVHALVLAALAWGLWTARAAFGPPGGPGALVVLLLPVAVLLGGWIRVRLAPAGDRGQGPERTKEKEGP